MDNLTENAPAKLSLLRKAQQAQRVDCKEPDAHKAAEKALVTWLLYPSDAADELPMGDLGVIRIIKKNILTSHN